VRDIRRIGVASLDLCSVAAGRLDAYYERGLNDWDQVGGVLVAAEAGAVVLGRSGAAPGRQLVLAAVPAVAGSLLEVLETFWADPETVRPELD
jgi:myo-inositol-1(or 4)-monophosphatase